MPFIKQVRLRPGFFLCKKANKVFGQAFFKRLAVSKDSVFGRAPQSAKFPEPEGAPQGDEFAK